MDPATIYAITVTLVGIGLPPKVTVEPLPPQWRMEDCIKDHEKKLSGRPNTMARCVSRDRPFKGPLDTDDEVVYGIDIIFGSPSRHPVVTVIEPKTPVTLEKCQRVFADRFANRPGIRAFCVKTRTKPETCDPHTNKCGTLTS